MKSGKDILEVGGWAIHPDRNEIERDGSAVRLEPMSMRLLLLLIDHHGRTTTRDEIVDCLWQGRIVSEDAITKQISKLRAALDDDSRAPAIIRTIPKVGVRLIPAPTSAKAAAATAARPSRAPLAVGLFLLVAVLVALAIFSREGEDSPLRIAQTPLTSTPGLEFDPALSPDGAWLAYASRPPGSAVASIRVRTLADETARTVTPPGLDAHSPTWSAGGQLAFVAARPGGCTIMVGSPVGRFRPVAPCASTLGLAWAGEERLIVAAHPRIGASFRLWSLDLGTGRARPITTPPAGALGDRFPVASTDSRTIYFARSQTVGVEHLLALDLASGRLRTLAAEDAHIVGLAPGGPEALLVSSNRGGGGMALWRLDLRRDRWQQILPAISGAPSASADGRHIVFGRIEQRSTLWARPIQGGPTEAITDSTQTDWLPVAAADGSLAFLSRRSGTRELWLMPTNGEPRRLTRFNGPEIQDPAWSPGAGRIALAVPTASNFDIVFVDVASGAVRRVTRGPADDRHPTFSPDGRTLYFARRDGTRYFLMRRELASGRETVLTSDGLRAIAAQDGSRLYFGRLFQPGLFELDLATGAVLRVADWPRWEDMRNWTYASGNLWGIARTGSGESRLMRLDPERGAQKTMGELPSLADASGLAIRNGQIVYSRLLDTQSDLVLLRIEDNAP